MARWFRLYEKKRGARRSGSETIGTALLALFSAGGLIGGLTFLYVILYTLIIPEWRVNWQFVEGTCRVVDKRLAERTRGDVPLFRADIDVQYSVDGITYRRWTYRLPRSSFQASREEKQAILDRFDVDKTYPCWYDPVEPETVVLDRGFTWTSWVLMLVPASLVVLGGGALAYLLINAGKSAERRAVAGSRTRAGEILGGVSAQGAHPGIPRDTNLTDSPGTHESYRLPQTLVSPLPMALPVTLSVVSLGVAIGFGAVAVRGENGSSDWYLLAFALLWLLIGVAGLVFGARRFVLSRRVGPTIVEISNHPLYPGREYRLFVSQAARDTLDRIRVSLICEEKATFAQGTNTRIHVRQVQDLPVLCEQHVAIPRGGAAEYERIFEIPRDVMHSFTSEHNEISWAIVVSGVAPVEVEFERRFGVIVYPPPEDRNHE